MTRVPKPQEIYRHFKGNLYQIITVAEHSETGERLVIYQALYGDFKIYARELGMFTSRVDRVKYPNAKQEYRFMLLEREGMDEAAEESRDKNGKNFVENIMAKNERDKEVVKENNKESVKAGSQIDRIVAKDASKETVKDTVKETVKETTKEVAKEVAFESSKETEKELSQEAVKEGTKAESESKEPELDPMLLEFLDANTYEAKLNILAGVHHRITQDMITTMAVSCDVEVGDGELEDRYRQLKTCLLTLEKYECNRLG